MWELNCSLKGIIELAETSKYVIRSDLINSDLIELHFSVIRELYHNRTPNILHYGSLQNSVILGQPVAGMKKSTNAATGYPKPKCMYKNNKLLLNS